MLRKRIHLQLELKISVPKNTSIFGVARHLSLKVKQISPVHILGTKTLGLEEVMYSGEKNISPELIAERALNSLAVGYLVAGHFWDDIDTNVPEAWWEYSLVFGDMFEGEDKQMRILVLSCKERTFEYVVVTPNFIPPSNYRFVCYLDR